MEITQKTMTLIAIIAVAAIIASTAYFMLEDEEEQQVLTLATTTSTYDSGLLDYMLPIFEEDNDCEVDILSVGTGQALEIGKSGDCDVVLVHARSSEDAFMADGYGSMRFCVMYNDFIIVGPFADPANLAFAINVTQAMQAIYNEGEAGKVQFVSRGDDSGTHKREQSLWALAGYDYSTDIEGKDWYLDVGSGMGDTLRTTNEYTDAYTLTDRGTWIALKAGLLNLKITFPTEKEDPDLLNPYGVMTVNKTLHSHVNFNLAKKFVKFLISAEGQQLIDSFTKEDEEGKQQQLFFSLWDEDGHHKHDTNCPTIEEEEQNRPLVGLDIPTSVAALSEGILVIEKFAIHS
jgi:tungstate transport system substrate-binding protein